MKPEIREQTEKSILDQESGPSPVLGSGTDETGEPLEGSRTDSFPMVLRCTGNGCYSDGVPSDITPMVCACGAPFKPRFLPLIDKCAFQCATCDLKEEAR